MALLNHIVAKTTLTAGSAQQVYICPAGKTHAIIDLTFYKEDTSQDALIAVALSTESNPANLTSVDYFVDDIELIGIVNSAELTRIIVGQGERLYVKVVSGPNIVVRMTGAEENNPIVAKAGRLAAQSIPTTSQTQVFTNSYSNVAYISTSVTLFNTSSSNSATVQLWVTSSASPAASDKVMKVTIPANDTTIVENLKLDPNEKIFVQSSLTNTEVFINGVVALNA
jgi:WD40 repeat protein